MSDILFKEGLKQVRHGIVIQRKQVNKYTRIVPVYLFTCLLTCLASHHFQGIRQYLKTDPAEIRSRTGKDFSIGMDVERSIGCERKFPAGAHLHFFEAPMRTFHHFRYNAKHHRSADVPD